jgi:hypothetical protein
MYPSPGSSVSLGACEPFSGLLVGAQKMKYWQENWEHMPLIMLPQRSSLRELTRLIIGLFICAQALGVLWWDNLEQGWLLLEIWQKMGAQLNSGLVACMNVLVVVLICLVGDNLNLLQLRLCVEWWEMSDVYFTQRWVW